MIGLLGIQDTRFIQYPVVQSATGQGTASASIAATMGAGVGAGGRLTVAVVNSGQNGAASVALTSMTNDKGDTYTVIDGKADSTGINCYGSLAYCLNTTAAATVFTGTIAGAALLSSMVVFEIGIVGATLDAHVSAVGSSTAPQSGASASTAQAIELAIGWIARNNASAISANLPSQNLTTKSNTIMTSDLFIGTTSSVAAQTASATLGTSALWICGIAMFKASVPSGQGGQGSIVPTLGSMNLP